MIYVCILKIKNILFQICYVILLLGTGGGAFPFDLELSFADPG